MIKTKQKENRRRRERYNQTIKHGERREREKKASVIYDKKGKEKERTQQQECIFVTKGLPQQCFHAKRERQFLSLSGTISVSGVVCVCVIFGRRWWLLGGVWCRRLDSGASHILNTITLYVSGGLQ